MKRERTSFKKSQYRSKYSAYLGVEIPNSHDVHHLDHDRSNDDVSNLVAIPRKLHKLYHYHVTYSKILEFQLDLIPEFFSKERKQRKDDIRKNNRTLNRLISEIAKEKVKQEESINTLTNIFKF